MKWPISVLLFASLSLCLSAGPTPIASLMDLVRQSDIIVVGSCTDVEVAQDGVWLVVTPDRIIKGSGSSAPERFWAAGRVASSGNVTQLKSQEVILFGVKGQQAGEWLLLDSDQSLPVETVVLHGDRSQGFAPLITTSITETPLQRAIKEIGSLYAVSPTNTSLELLMPLGWGRIEPKTTAIVFAMLSDSSKPEVRQAGLIGLTTLGLPQSVMATDQLVSSGNPDATKQLSLVERFYDSDDPEAMKIIVSWLQSPTASVRATAAGVLAKSGSREAAMLLGDTLEDTEFEVRWRAVGGLSVFANHVPRNSPAPDLRPWPLRTDQTIEHSVFDRSLMAANERYYLEFWRAWWNENKLKVAAIH